MKYIVGLTLFGVKLSSEPMEAGPAAALRQQLSTLGLATMVPVPETEKRIEIPSREWKAAIKKAVADADKNTIIIVDCEGKKKFALAAAGECVPRKYITVQIDERMALRPAT